MGSLSMWTEGITLTLVFVAVFTVAVVSLNVSYDKDYNTGLASESTEQMLIDYQESAQKDVRGGEVEFTSDNGLTFKQAYHLLLGAVDMIWNFITGGFIEELFGKFGLGAPGMILAVALRGIWFLSLVFALVYIAFGVEP